VSLLRWPRRCPHSLPTELDAQVRADGTNNRGLLHERHRRGRKVVQARATGLGCHGAVPVVCQKKNRLSPCPLAVITVDFLVWATDGVEKVVPAGHLFRVPGGGSDGLPEKRQASIRAVAGDTAGVPAWATEGADATLFGTSHLFGMPGVRSRWSASTNRGYGPRLRRQSRTRENAPVSDRRRQ
jgi:hypothetical protein